jgi:hypothetical protein
MNTPKPEVSAVDVELPPLPNYVYFQPHHVQDYARQAVSAALAKQAGQSEAVADAKTWCAYIAGMICTYLNYPLDMQKERAIAGIIERRMKFLPTPQPSPVAQPVQPVQDKQTPFVNCKFRICDLPGQCKGEGKCHHPLDAAPLAQPVNAELRCGGGHNGSDYCSWCGRKMWEKLDGPCPERVLLKIRSTPDADVIAFGCKYDDGSGDRCAKWCKSPSCAVSLHSNADLSRTQAAQPQQKEGI